MENTPSIPPETTSAAVSGPVFISVDDAAYWAHQQIGSRRDTTYGGFILRRADGKFLPAVPQAEWSSWADQFAVLNTGSAYIPYFPEGYTCAASFFSPAANHAEVQRLHPDWSLEQVKLSLGFFTRPRLLGYLDNVTLFGQWYYVSGPDGSLIKYESREPDAIKAVINAQTKSKSTQSFNALETLIQTMAIFGTLTVVVANAQWGGVRGEVPQTWKLGVPVGYADPIKYQPFYSSVGNQAGDAITAASRGVTLQQGASQLGFVLKSATGNEWIATYPISPRRQQDLRHPQLALKDTFPIMAGGKLEKVADFQLDGLYFIRGAEITGSGQEPWLYERFFSTADLAAGITFSIADVYRQEYADFLKVYTLLLDGAVLQYQPSSNILEAPLKGSGPIEAQLKAGTLKPSDYVRQVAAAGALSVLNGSPLWAAGRVATDWQPYPQSRRLSPVFITADDAACFVQGHIGCRRDHAYAGLILQDRHQRFVATLPVPVTGARFALSRFCPIAADGTPLVLTEGYTLHGVYASRWIGDERPLGSSKSDQLTAAQMFTDDDIRVVLEQHSHLKVAYLSGSADSLLAYHPEPSKAAAREKLQSRVAVQADGLSTQTRELIASSHKPDDVLKELAGTGELNVVIGSDVWGPRASVYSDEEVSDRVFPRLGPVFSTPTHAVLNAHANACSDYRASASGLGFILKHNDRDEYVATEAVPAGRLDALSVACESEMPILVDEYQAHSVYYSGHWLHSGMSTADSWFARHFIPITDLYAASLDGKDAVRLAHQDFLNLYIATLDGALLQYQFSPTQTLFMTGEDSFGPQVLQSLMASEAPPFSGVMGSVIAAGNLKVLVGSECWGEPGAVSAQWKPFALTQRRELSPVFLWKDDAVRFAMARLGTRRDRIYGGLVLRRTDGLFVATLPVPVASEAFPANWIRLDELADKGEFLTGSTVVARYHSRCRVEPVFALSSREYDVYSNMFSTDFLAAVLPLSNGGTLHSPGTEYLLGLDDNLLRYTLSDSEQEKQLARALASPSKLQLRQSPLELQMRTAQLQPSEFVEQVAKAGHLYVVQDSRLWGNTRRLSQWGGGYTPTNPALRRFAVGDPALSPVFTQADDAVRYAHRQVNAQGDLMFGFLLKSLTAERYVTTLAVQGEFGNFTQGRVFPHELLPLGYSVLGLYLRAPAPPSGRTDDIFRSFVIPHDLARGLDAVRVSSSRSATYLKLYLSCADGALLRYQPTTADAHWANFSATEMYWTEMEAGRESLREYLRKVVRNGELRVVERSEFWSPVKLHAKGGRTGIDLVQWPQDNRFALGPLLAHVDDAARWAQQQVGSYTNKQFLGGILGQSDGQSYVAIEPLEDGTSGAADAAARLFYSGRGGPIAPIAVPGVAPLPLPQFPPGLVLVGVHQFYKKVDVLVNIITDVDRRLADNLALGDLRFSTLVLARGAKQGSSCYLTCRGGALLKFTPTHTASETAALNTGLSMGVTTFFNTLLGTSRLQVLEVDEMWRRRGPIAVGWAPETSVTDETHRERDEL